MERTDRTDRAEQTGRPRDAKIPYSAGIDGLRGLAVLAVLVFHAGPTGWLPGGFLGVSLFFTLSGYLITSLVLAEVEGTGHLSLARFWARRVRRLVPALLLMVLGVVVLARTIELPRSTRGELLGGLAYVANWRFLAAGTSYGATYADQSPLLHFWSLAIEEQFYLVFPLLAVLAFSLKKRWDKAPFVVLGLGALASLGAGIAGVADVADRLPGAHARALRHG